LANGVVVVFVRRHVRARRCKQGDCEELTH
jgi:hypothetical protein